MPVPSLHDELVKMKANAKKRLDEMIASEQAEGLSVTEWIREGDPVKEILDGVLKRYAVGSLCSPLPEGAPGRAGMNGKKLF